MFERTHFHNNRRTSDTWYHDPHHPHVHDGLCPSEAVNHISPFLAAPIVISRGKMYAIERGQSSFSTLFGECIKIIRYRCSNFGVVYEIHLRVFPPGLNASEKWVYIIPDAFITHAREVRSLKEVRQVKYDGKWLEEDQTS